MSYQPTKPADNEKLKDTPAQLRGNWDAITAGTVWSGVSTAGFLLKSTGAVTPPVWGLPENLQIASQAQGTILYYSGSAWVVLAVGTNGNILKTQGAGANPAWTDTAPKAADMVIGSQAQGDILYFNGTNWVRLAAGTSGYFLKTQGAGANPTWATLTAATDLSLTGQEQGDVAYFNGSNWVVLHHGTDGQYLKSRGHGANPEWGTVAAGAPANDYVSGSNYLIFSLDTERFGAGTNGTMRKIKSIIAVRDGSIYVSFDAAKSSQAGSASARVYVNGSPVGTLRNVTSNHSTFQNFAETISGVNYGDEIQIYGDSSSHTWYVRNFRIYATVPTVEAMSFDQNI